jgi:hypothetical protein
MFCVNLFSWGCADFAGLTIGGLYFGVAVGRGVIEDVTEGVAVLSGETTAAIVGEGDDV